MKTLKFISSAAVFALLLFVFPQQAQAYSWSGSWRVSNVSVPAPYFPVKMDLYLTQGSWGRAVYAVATSAPYGTGMCEVAPSVYLDPNGWPIYPGVRTWYPVYQDTKDLKVSQTVKVRCKRDGYNWGPVKTVSVNP